MRESYGADVTVNGPASVSEDYVAALEDRVAALEALLPDVDEALGKYGMAVTTTGGPPMGSAEKQQAFEDARRALRRVRDTLARRL